MTALRVVLLALTAAAAVLASVHAETLLRALDTPNP
jgi:hypothetical protein